MHLRNIWILNRTGLVMYQQALLLKIDGQGVGYFLSSIYTFARQIYAKGLSGFQVEGTNYFSKIDHEILFIASAPIEANKEETNKEFERIVQLFFTSFSEKKIKAWNGDITAFKEFGKIIEASFKLS